MFTFRDIQGRGRVSDLLCYTHRQYIQVIPEEVKCILQNMMNIQYVIIHKVLFGWIYFELLHCWQLDNKAVKTTSSLHFGIRCATC